MVIYGFDLSSRKIAVVTFDGDVDVFTAEVKKQQSRAQELLQLSQALDEYLGGRVPGYCYIEAPVVGRGGARPTVLQSQVDGLIQVAALRSGQLGCYSVNNKTWKKAIVGNGNASKEQSAAWLAATHPVLSDLVDGDQDLVDAACVAIYGARVVERAQGLGGALQLDP